MVTLFVSVPEVPVMTNWAVLVGGAGLCVGVGEPPPQPANEVKTETAIANAKAAVRDPNL